MGKLNDDLRSFLGDEYGGPSISYDHGKGVFVYYTWGDAPTSTHVLAAGVTFTELVNNIRKLDPSICDAPDVRRKEC